MKNKLFFQFVASLFWPNRAVYHAAPGGEAAREAAEKAAAATKEKFKTWKEINAEANFDAKAKGYNEVFKALAEKAYEGEERRAQYRTEIQKALEEQLKANGSGLDEMWTDLGETGCKKVTIENGHFKFLDGSGKEIPVLAKAIPVPFEAKLKIENADVKIKPGFEKNYDPSTGKIRFYTSREEKEITIVKMFDGLQKGDTVLIAAPGESPKTGVFNGKDVVYRNNRHAIILNDYQVTFPARKGAGVVEEPVRDEAEEAAAASATVEEQMREYQRRANEIEDKGAAEKREKDMQNVEGKYHDYLQKAKKVEFREEIAALKNDPKKWAQVWEAGKMEGVRELKRIIREEPAFASVSENELRDAVYRMVHGIDRIVSIKDVVNEIHVYVKKNGKPGDFGDFRKEYNDSKSFVVNYEGSGKLEVYNQYQERISRETTDVERWTRAMKAARDKADSKDAGVAAQGKAEVQKLETEYHSDAMKPVLTKWANFMNSKERQEYLKYQETVKRVPYLTSILSGCGKMLDAIGTFETVRVVKEDAADHYYATLKELDKPENLHGLRVEGQYFPLNQMKNDKRDKADDVDFKDPKVLEDSKYLKVTITANAAREFETAVTNACGGDKKAFEMFKDAENKLRLILRVYTLTALMNEGCLKQVEPKGKGKYVLVKLPENFSKPENAQLIADFVKNNRNDYYIDDTFRGLQEMRDHLDENMKVERALRRIFNLRTERVTVGETKGKAYSMEDVASGYAAKYSPNYYRQNFVGDAGFNRIRDRLIETKGYTTFFSETKAVSELNRLLQFGLNAAGLDNNFNAEEFYKRNGGSREAALKKLTLTDLAGLSQDQIQLIRIGFVAEEKITEAKEATELSSHPVIRAAQEQLLKMGYPPADMKKVENLMHQKINAGVGFTVDTTREGWKKIAVGGGAMFDVGHGFNIGFGIGINPAAHEAVLGMMVGWTGRTEKGVSGGFQASAGIGTDFQRGVLPGGGIALFTEFPLGKTSWRMNLSAGVSVGFVGLGVGGGIGFAQDIQKAQELAIQDAYEKNDINAIDKIENPAEKIKKIKENPYFGDLFKELSKHMDDQGLLVLYHEKRIQLRNAAAQKTKISPILRFGFAVTVGTEDIASLGLTTIAKAALGIIGYLTFKVGEEMVVVRKESPYQKGMDDVIRAKQNAAIEEQVRKDFGMKATIETRVSLGESPNIIYDQDGNVAILKDSSEAVLKNIADITKASERAEAAGIKLEFDPGTKLIEVVPLNAKGNMEICIDPQMGKTGLIVRDGKIYIAAGKMPTLAFRRGEYYYPAAKEGSSKHTLITISDNPMRNPMDIRDSSGTILFKQKDAKMDIRRGYNDKKQDNVARFEDYQAGKTKMYAGAELYNETIDTGSFKEDTDRMARALRAVERGERVRDGILPKEKKDGTSFVEQFLAKHLKEYREWTTNVSPRFDQSTLGNALQKNFEATAIYQADSKKLNAAEMNAVFMQLSILSLSKTDKPGEFERRLNWAKQRILIPMFQEKMGEMKGVEFTYTAAQLAEIAVQDSEHLKDKVAKWAPGDLADIDSDTRVAIAVGARVGGKKLEGVRAGIYAAEVLQGMDYSKYLGSKTDRARGEIAKLLLEGLSPLSEEDNEFMKSALAIELAGTRPLWVVLGRDTYNKIAECFEKRTVSPENRKAFDAFKELVAGIRQAQFEGKKTFTYKNEQGQEYMFGMKNKVGTGAYAECTNYTLYADEDFVVYAPREGATVYAAKGAAITNMTPYALKAAYGFSLFGGVKVALPTPGETPPVTPVVPPAAPEGTVQQGEGPQTNTGQDTGNE